MQLTIIDFNQNAALIRAREKSKRIYQDYLKKYPPDKNNTFQPTPKPTQNPQPIKTRQ